MKFFVYGTLKTGECRESVFSSYCKSGDYTVKPARIRAELYDLGYYPAILEGNNIVRGEMVTIEDPEDYKVLLDRIDAIEGYSEHSDHNLYNRKKVTVFSDGEEHEAWAYFYANSNRLTEADRMTEEEWTTCTKEYEGARG